MENRKVSGGIVINEGKILLIKRRYEPNKNAWCPPGGFTEKSINESVEDCYIREVKEETNIDIDIIKKLDILKFYNKIKDRNEEIYVFLCRPKSTEIVIGGEVSDVKWIILNEINNLSLIPGFSDFILKHKEYFI